jgi:ech hydrogenase subunit A
MIIGIAGMFLAPLGMLISKWAAMTAFVDSMNIFLVMMICFGSSATIFYWAKWLGKMAAVVSGAENIQARVHKGEWGVLGTLACFTVLACLVFPVISHFAVVPHLATIFLGENLDFFSIGTMWIMAGMMVAIVLLPLFFFGKTKNKIVNIYLAGANVGNDRAFRGAMDKEVPVSLRNWYMEKYFGEDNMNKIGTISSAFIIVTVFSIIVGGVLL